MIIPSICGPSQSRFNTGWGACLCICAIAMYRFCGKGESIDKISWKSVVETGAKLWRNIYSQRLRNLIVPSLEKLYTDKASSTFRKECAIACTFYGNLFLCYQKYR